jgi:hypothetical protein
MPKKTAKFNYRKGVWFAQLRGSYIPISWQGWITYIPFVGYLVYSLVVALAYTGNDWKAVLWVVPNWVAAAVIMSWVARLKS